jgi:hypothetical protein
VNAEGVKIGDTQGTRAERFRRPLIDSARQSV